MKQKRLYKLAVFLHIISSLFATFAAFSALLNGPTEQGAVEGVPQVVVVLSTMLGVAGLASAYGLWQGQKWAIWLTILIQALNGLLSLPAFFGARSLRPSSKQNCLSDSLVWKALHVRPLGSPRQKGQ